MKKKEIWMSDVILFCVEMRMGSDTGCAVTRRYVSQEANGFLCRGEKCLGVLEDSWWGGMEGRRRVVVVEESRRWTDRVII